MNCLILLLAILPFCLSSPCDKDEYWSTFSKICLKCTQCKKNQIVIKSCQAHKDTLCSIKSDLIKHNKLDNKEIKSKKSQHFDKSKLHFISNEDAEQEILDNELYYPKLNLIKKLNDNNEHHKINKKKYNDGKKQRINDKFLKWKDDDVNNDDVDSDDDDENDDDYNYDDYDYDYDNKKHKSTKTNNHKLINKQKTKQKQQHHFSSSNDDDDDDDEDDDYNYDDDEEENEDEEEDDEDETNDENNLDSILDKHAKNPWNTKKWKDNLDMSKSNKKKSQKNDKNLARLAKLEDEKKLEEWLRQSRKQFKDRKDNLLKTLKEEQLDNYKNDKRIRLNYPLLNLNDKFGDTIKYSTKSTIDDKLKTHERKQHGGMDSEVELFKELIKNEESQEMELATLMSNKKEPTIDHYKPVTPAHRMFLGEPSSDLVKLGGHIKDPQEVIKEEMGDNFLYEKSKFTVLPLMNGENNGGMMEFSAAERLVWDWQALAVISAVISSLLFFLVIGIFLLSNARHWSSHKHRYNEDSEELSTRVALIQPTLEASAAEGSNTSKFLEQFLTVNEERKNKSENNTPIAK